MDFACIFTTTTNVDIVLCIVYIEYTLLIFYAYLRIKILVNAVLNSQNVFLFSVNLLILFVHSVVARASKRKKNYMHFMHMSLYIISTFVYKKKHNTYTIYIITIGTYARPKNIFL